MDDIRREIMCAWTLARLGEKRLILPLNATRAIDNTGIRAVYISGGAAAWQTAMAEASALQFAVHLDGIAASLCFISVLTESGLSIGEWFGSIPSACRSYRRIPMPPKQSGAALKKLFENCSGAQFGGGIRLPGEDGWAFLSPDDVQPEMCVMAEAARYETADELCFFYAKQLEALSKNADD
jgi:phosphomannomutase